MGEFHYIFLLCNWDTAWYVFTVNTMAKMTIFKEKGDATFWLPLPLIFTCNNWCPSISSPHLFAAWNKKNSKTCMVTSIRDSLCGEAELFRAISSILKCKRVWSLALNSLAFPIEAASVAGSFTPFTPFIVYLLLKLFVFTFAIHTIYWIFTFVLALTATSVCMQSSITE